MCAAPRRPRPISEFTWMRGSTDPKSVALPQGFPPTQGPRRTVYAEVDGGVGIPLLQSPRSRQAKEHRYTCAVSFAFYSSSTKAIAPERGPARSICR